jgi:hypothetical protein
LTKKLCPETFSWETFIGAEVTLRSKTLLVAVCPTVTAPKLTEPGETLSGPLAEELGANPQPASATKRQHADMTNSLEKKPSDLRIELRPSAQYELNNVSPLCKRASFSEADKQRIVKKCYSSNLEAAEFLNPIIVYVGKNSCRPHVAW